MQSFAKYGPKHFVICLGDKGYMVKEYLANYFLHMTDVTIDPVRNQIEFHRGAAENWKVTLVDTGPLTMTGGRLKRVRDYQSAEPFCMTLTALGRPGAKPQRSCASSTPSSAKRRTGAGAARPDLQGRGRRRCSCSCPGRSREPGFPWFLPSLSAALKKRAYPARC
jgi:hypothetical protein